jgi:hypothetical protein
MGRPNPLYHPSRNVEDRVTNIEIVRDFDPFSRDILALMTVPLDKIRHFPTE